MGVVRYWAALTLIVVIAATVVIIVLLPQEEAIRIGAIQPLSKSTVATGTYVREGIDMAVEDVNSQGGINGRKLEVVYEDDQCDTKLAVNAFRKLADIDKVTIAIGPTCSSNVLAVAPLANEKRVIVLTTVASTPKVTDAGDYIFRNTPSGKDYSDKIAEFAFNNLSARTASTLYLNLDNGIDFNIFFAKRFEELGGTVLNQESYEKDEKDFRTQLLKIKKNNPDVIFVAGQINPGLAVVQMRELRLNQQVIAPITIENPEFLEQAGERAEGVIYSTLEFDPDDLRIQSFNERYTKTYNKTLSPRATISYDAVMLTASLLRKCGEDVECVKQGLYATKNYSGVAGTYSFDENGDVDKPLMIKTVKNGKFVPYE